MGSLDQKTKKCLEVRNGLKFSIRTLKIEANGYRNGSVLLLDKPQEADAWAAEMNTIFETITYYLGIRLECFEGHTHSRARALQVHLKHSRPLLNWTFEFRDSPGRP